jgi:undecaprenyl diphosphate synthase
MMAAMSESNATCIPKHIAIIMDGNGRWAKNRGLPRTAGHNRGAEVVDEVVDACQEIGVDYLTLYAFSAENWKRPKAEVSALMLLLGVFLKRKFKKMIARNVRLKTIGRTEELPPKLKDYLLDTIERTKQNTGITLTLALSYGGREEIVDATKKIAKQVAAGLLSPEEISKETIQNNLYSPETPDPDLLIRTSGEIRLSNFLLWQLSYTEMVLIDKFWPEFSKEDVYEAVTAYQGRHRRFGAIS